MVSDGLWLARRIATVKDLIQAHPENVLFQRQLDNLLQDQRYRDEARVQAMEYKQQSGLLVPLETSKPDLATLRDQLSKATNGHSQAESDAANHLRVLNQYDEKLKKARLDGDLMRVREVHEAIERRMTMHAIAKSKLEEFRIQMITLSCGISTLESSQAINDQATAKRGTSVVVPSSPGRLKRAPGPVSTTQHTQPVIDNNLSIDRSASQASTPPARKRRRSSNHEDLKFRHTVSDGDKSPITDDKLSDDCLHIDSSAPGPARKRRKPSNRLGFVPWNPQTIQRFEVDGAVRAGDADAGMVLRSGRSLRYGQST